MFLRKVFSQLFRAKCFKKSLLFNEIQLISKQYCIVFVFCSTKIFRQWERTYLISCFQIDSQLFLLLLFSTVL